MEERIIEPGDARYPSRLWHRLGAEAPTLAYQGPLNLLERFGLAVLSSDSIPAPAVLAANELLFAIREFACNYLGGWHSVMETEVFRLTLDRNTDPQGLRSLTILTAKGLPHESPQPFLAERFGKSGPFSDFPEKVEFFRRCESNDVLWLSASPQSCDDMPREAVLLRNRVACALADCVFIPFADRDSRTIEVAHWLSVSGIPAFTTGIIECANLHALGFKSLTRKDVPAYFKQLGARQFQTKATVETDSWARVEVFDPPGKGLRECSGEQLLLLEPETIQTAGR